MNCMTKTTKKSHSQAEQLFFLKHLITPYQTTILNHLQSSDGAKGANTNSDYLISLICKKMSKNEKKINLGEQLFDINKSHASQNDM